MTSSPPLRESRRRLPGRSHLGPVLAHTQPVFAAVTGKVDARNVDHVIARTVRVIGGSPPSFSISAV